MSLSHNTKIVKDGLVYHIDAANVKSYSGSGTDVTDLSKTRGLSTLTNGAGVSNNVFTFDGVDDYISVPSVTLTQWTFCYWFYHDSPDSADMTVGKKGDTGNRFYHRDTGNNYKLRVHNNDSVSIGDMIIGDLRQQWTHLAYGIDTSGSIHGWINGERAATRTTSNSTTFVFDAIGDVYTSGFYWLGSLNNIMCYNRKLTDKEIRTNFNATRDRFDI